jgi:hypothetical protein
MKIQHEICITNGVNSVECCDAVLTALGHSPTFKLKADSPTDTVHGAVTIIHCDPCILGADILRFQNGQSQVATADNVGLWFEELGHKLVKIVGNKAFCNTLIEIKITDTDEAPNASHKTTYKRPDVMPTQEECRSKIDAHMLLAGITTN